MATTSLKVQITPKKLIDVTINAPRQVLTDADTVDGYHASSFVQKTGDTMTGTLTINLSQTSNTLGAELISNGDFSTVPDTAWQWGSTWQHDTTNLRAQHTSSTGGVAVVTIDNGGTGYAVNDVLTIVGGNNDAQIKVTSVSGGRITGITIVSAGSGYSTGSGFATTGGSGTGCVVSIQRLVDDTNTLSQNVSIQSGKTYLLSFTVTNRTKGWVRFFLGGASSPYFPSSSSCVLTTTNTTGLSIIATIDFDGAIDNISLKEITLSSPILSLSGISEIRGNAGTTLGYQALRFNTTGQYNTAVGYQSLYSNTTGQYNTAVGYASLRNNTTGYNNTAVGNLSLYYNTTGYNNTAVGYASLFSNTTGYNNTAVGLSSLYYNTTGYQNIAVGYKAGYNETGSKKLYIAYDSTESATFIYGDGNTQRIGIFTVSPTNPLDINGNSIRIRSSRTISSSSSAGYAGEICWDSNYLYVCVATNTWKRVALSSF